MYGLWTHGESQKVINCSCPRGENRFIRKIPEIVRLTAVVVAQKLSIVSGRRRSLYQFTSYAYTYIIHIY
jgi:hypothetical protein